MLMVLAIRSRTAGDGRGAAKVPLKIVDPPATYPTIIRAAPILAALYYLAPIPTVHFHAR